MARHQWDAPLGSTGLGARGGTGGGGAGATGTGGASAVGGAAGGTGDPAGYVPALIGVGYGGIRIVSRDGGKTWGDRAYATTSGGDDEELLRAVAYGKGLWIATGWKLVTSTDGVHWTDRGLIKNGKNKIPGCSIVEGLAYNAGYFFAACTPWDSPGVVFRSSDGLSWTKYGTIGDTGGHLSPDLPRGKVHRLWRQRHQLPVERRAHLVGPRGHRRGDLLPGHVQDRGRMQGLELVRRRLAARRLAGDYLPLHRTA